MIRVLLVEDDRDLAQTLLQIMELAALVPDYSSNGVAAMALIRKNAYDVLVLDVGLPKMDGLTLCQQLRDEGVDTPILFLTARDTLDDKLAGFAAGGDDYLVKPFDNEELLARIRVLSRRRSGEVQQLRLADLMVDIKRHKVFRSGTELKLAPAPFTILETLLRASPAIVSRHELEFALWGEDMPDSNALKVHIHYLRKALDHGQAKPLLHTVAGKGWVLLDKELDKGK